MRGAALLSWVSMIRLILSSKIFCCQFELCDEQVIRNKKLTEEQRCYPRCCDPDCTKLAEDNWALDLPRPTLDPRDKAEPGPSEGGEAHRLHTVGQQLHKAGRLAYEVTGCMRNLSESIPYQQASIADAIRSGWRVDLFCVLN